MSFAASEFAVGFDHAAVFEVATPVRRTSWEEVDHALRELARCRSALDADEARLLVIAVRDEVWRKLGAGSLHDYLENVLGHGPREARERIRVARAIADMPPLEDALATGVLHWSAVRELTRVATPNTVDEWLAAAHGKNLRQIEQLVSGRKKGDRPTDAPDPDTATRRLVLELTPESIAILRRARQQLEAERSTPVDDDALVAALGRAYLEGGADTERGLARFQVLTVVCEACGAAAHEAGGRRYPIDETSRAIAECDAQRIGSERSPTRATQDVTPATRRFVHRRDSGRCTVPGCRASRFIDVHHIVQRRDGGAHDAENITLLCDSHHRALHEGKLTITGNAPQLDVRWSTGSAVGRESPISPPTMDVPEPAMTYVGREPDAGGESTTLHGPTMTHVGREPDARSEPATLHGPTMTHVGREPDARSESMTLRGPTMTHVGREPDARGEPATLHNSTMTHVGRELDARGEPATLRGSTMTHVGREPDAGGESTMLRRPTMTHVGREVDARGEPATLHGPTMTHVGRVPDVRGESATLHGPTMTHVGHVPALTRAGHASALIRREVCEHADMLRDAKLALVTLKFPKAAAHAAVDAAWEKVRADPAVDLERLIRVSLRSLHDPR